MEHKKTEVTIFNQTFDILSNKIEEAELLELASFVDKKMTDIFKSTNLSSALKVAVLTALNLAEELSYYKKKYHDTDLKDDVYDEVSFSHTLISLSKRIDSIREWIVNNKEGN